MYETTRYMTPEEMRARLPKVGDRRLDIPTVDETARTIVKDNSAPQRYIVIEVNRAHLWYRVRFENGFTECYKLPKYKTDREVRER
jgi:hypothetical protein